MVRGKPSNKKPFCTIRLLQALGDQPENDVIGHQAACVHDLLCRQPHRRTGLDRLAQHVAGGYLRNAVLLGNERSLRSLAGTRPTQQDQFHARLSKSCISD
jgi:hypothetical protein